MKVIGITGGVGAGKSTVLQYLAGKYRARIIQADQVGHYLMEPGQVCYYKIIESFGSGILNGDQTICRSRLAAVVFQDKDALKKLNKIVHPAVKEYIIQAVAEEKTANTVPFTVIEAALLIEDHYEVVCDELWYIYASEEVRKARLMASRGYTEEKVKDIMKNQLPESEFFARSHFVVDNNSDFMENTFEQIDKGMVEHGIM